MTVFIQKGDAPMSVRQAIKRGLRHFNAEKAQWEREQGVVESDPDYMAWAAQWVTDNKANAAHNLFNHQLAAYRKAVARLARYEVALGREELTEQVETEEYDPETGEPVTETVVIQTAIDPVEATVEQIMTDPETGEVTGTEVVTNPLIVTDEADRTAAQAVIDGTPEAVTVFDQ